LGRELALWMPCSIATSGPSPAKFSGHVRRSFLDIRPVETAADLDHEARHLDEVSRAADGPPAREGNEGVGIPAVRQCPVDRPQPAVLAPEVEGVFPPVPVDEDDCVFLPVPRMERMFDAETVTAFLQRRCS